jgi:nucleotide-binding universal stress UspA family protein
MSQKHILVPVDFSEGSRAALRYAAMLADKLGARLEVLHVWEPSPYVAPTQLVWIGDQALSFWSRATAQLGAQLDELVREEVPQAAHPIATRVEPGHVPYSILEQLRAQPYEMCVVGTHGRTGISHLVLGSVAERIVRHAPCPVLTVRLPAGEQKELAKKRERSDEVVPTLRGFDSETPTAN